MLAAAQKLASLLTENPERLSLVIREASEARVSSVLPASAPSQAPNPTVYPLTGDDPKVKWMNSRGELIYFLRFDVLWAPAKYSSQRDGKGVPPTTPPDKDGYRVTMTDVMNASAIEQLLQRNVPAVVSMGHLPSSCLSDLQNVFIPQWVGIFECAEREILQHNLRPTVMKECFLGILESMSKCVSLVFKNGCTFRRSEGMINASVFIWASASVCNTIAQARSKATAPNHNPNASNPSRGGRHQRGRGQERFDGGRFDGGFVPRAGNGPG